MSNNCTIISIEGNIGSGKSTLLANLREYFKDNDNVVFLKEPVDEWEKIKDKDGITILEKFYADQEKYSFPFYVELNLNALVNGEEIERASRRVKETHWRLKSVPSGILLS